MPDGEARLDIAACLAGMMREDRLEFGAAAARSGVGFGSEASWLRSRALRSTRWVLLRRQFKARHRFTAKFSSGEESGHVRFLTTSDLSEGIRWE